MYNRTQVRNKIKSIMVNKNLYRMVLLLIAALSISAFLPQSSFFAQEKDNKPDNKSKVKFLIRAVDAKEKKNKAIFRVGEKIYIEALIKNDSDENYPDVVIDTYYQYHFNLQKVGERGVKEYRKDKIKAISNGQRKPTSFSRLVALPIKKGESRLLGKFDLNIWYEDVESGEYELTVQYRSNPGMPVLTSNTIVIEIIEPEN